MLWLYRIANSGIVQFLSKLNVSPQVIDFVTKQDPNKQQLLTNILAKNPNTTIEQLQTSKKFNKNYIQNTQQEEHLASTFEDPVYRNWVLNQYSRFRITDNKYRLPGGAIVTMWNFNEALRNINDWRVDQKIKIESFTFAAAKTESDLWHAAIAAQGKGLFYDQVNPQNIVYGPTWQKPQFEGWTIQRITSKNDLLVEGNRMDHCVNNSNVLCQVEKEDLFVYSLRDPKNNPHVTIGSYAQIGTPDVVIREIQGKGNTEPLRQYKEMIKEWFKSLANKPDMTDINQDFSDDDLIKDIKYTENRKIESLLDRYTMTENEYGLPIDVSNFDIKTIFETTLNELENNNYDMSFRPYMNGIAQSIAQLAHKKDQQWLSKHDMNLAKKNINEITKSLESYSGIIELWEISDKIHEDYPDFESGEPFPDEDDFETIEEYSKAIEEHERIEQEFMNEYMTTQLPYAFIHAINSYFNSKKLWYDPSNPLEFIKTVINTKVL